MTAIQNVLPDTSITVINIPSKYVTCNYKCLTVAYVNLRTEELFNEQKENTLDTLRYQSRIQALTEINDDFKDIILKK